MKKNKSDNLEDYSVVGAESAKKTSIPIIAGIGALVLVGACVLSYMFIPQVKNTVRLATLEPNEYLQTVIKDNCADLATSMTQQYDKNLQTYNMEDGLAYDYNLSVKLSDQLIDTLNQSMSESSGEALPDNFPTKYDIKGNINAKDSLSSINMELFANDTSLISASVVSDVENEKIYAQVPELSEGYIYVTPQEQSEEDDYSYDFYDTYAQSLEDFSLNGANLAEKGIEGKQIGDTFIKYTNMIVDNLTGETTLEKDVEGSVVSVSYKYNKLSTKVSDADCLSIGNKILDEMQSDEVVKAIVMDNDGITTDEEYNQKILDLKDNLNESVTQSDATNTLNTYVNSYGVICGFELVEDATNEVVSCMFAMDNLDYAIELKCDTTSMQIVANKNDKDTFTGTATILDDTNNLTLNFENVSLTDNGYLNGKFSTDISSFDVENFNNITIEAIAGEDSQTLNCDFSGQFSLSTTVSLVDATSVSIPTGDMYDYNTQFEDYSSTINETFYEDILTKLGLYDWYQEKLNSSTSDNDVYDYDDYITSDDNYSNDTYSDIDNQDDVDYDDSTDDTSQYGIFDFNNLNITLNSEKIEILGAPNSYILSLPCYEDETTTNSAYYSDNDTIYVEVEDNKMTYFEIAQGYEGSFPDVEFNVNGIKLGSSYEDINRVFGTSANNTTSYVSILDQNNFNSEVSFYMTDGVVNYIYWYTYED